MSDDKYYVGLDGTFYARDDDGALVEYKTDCDGDLVYKDAIYSGEESRLDLTPLVPKSVIPKPEEVELADLLPEVETEKFSGHIRAEDVNDLHRETVRINEAPEVLDADIESLAAQLAVKIALRDRLSTHQAKRDELLDRLGGIYLTTMGANVTKVSEMSQANQIKMRQAMLRIVEVVNAND